MSLIVMDIPNAFIQTLMPQSDEKTQMKVKGLLLGWLLELDFAAYATCVVMERCVKTLYLVLEKVIHVVVL